MRRFLLFTGIVALAAPFATAQTSTWAIDSNHSQIEFVVKHLALSNIHGRFGNLKGNITMNDTDITKSTVQVTIDVTSLDTGVAQRDSDVKGPNFFDTAKFPSATFASTSVAKKGMGLTVTGDLTLHGVTRPVTFAMQGILDGNSVTGTGKAIVQLPDFQMKPPQTTSVLTITVDEHVTLLIHFTAHRTGCPT